MAKSWGVILLAIWLIIYAVVTLTNLQIVAMTVIQGCLAAGAGICLLIGK